MDEPSTAPEPGEVRTRDWLLLEEPSNSPARSHRHWPRRLWTGTRRLQQIWQKAFHRAEGLYRKKLNPSVKSVSLPKFFDRALAVREFSARTTRQFLTCLGPQFRRAAYWARSRLRWRGLGKFAAATFATAAIACLAYAGYCLATIPYNAGLVIDPTASALLVQADDGSRIWDERRV
jgi:hypothetical protein